MVKSKTNAIHGHDYTDSFGTLIPPIYTSVTHEYVNKFQAITNDQGRLIRYSREENPTVHALEKVLTKLENAEDALAFSSGMSSIATILLYALKSEKKIVIPKETYSATLQLLEILSQKMNFKLVKAYPSAEKIVEATDEKTTMVFTEVMTNPTLKIIDLEYLKGGLRCENYGYFGLTIS